MRINTTAMAMTSSRWMNPPSVVEVTTPSTHRINNTTKMVHSICQLAFNQVFNHVILVPSSETHHRSHSVLSAVINGIYFLRADGCGCEFASGLASFTTVLFLRFHQFLQVPQENTLAA